MSVRKDPSGRRWVQVEVEVPGTPEQVWDAIATGPGVSSWFVPTRVETDAAGKPVRVIRDFGPGMESVATVKSWDPPRSYTAESPDDGSGAPPLAKARKAAGRVTSGCCGWCLHISWVSQRGNSVDGRGRGAEGGRVGLAHRLDRPWRRGGGTASHGDVRRPDVRGSC